jgi:hypothetical protein
MHISYAFKSSLRVFLCSEKLTHRFCGQKLYLVGSLHALIKSQSKTIPATLLAAHVRLLLALAHLPSPPSPPQRILRIARRYTSTAAPPDADLWLVRLRAESAHGTTDSIAEAWTSARRALPTCAEIWLWGADRCCCPPRSESWEEFDALLAESMRDATLRDVHQSLLLRVAESMGSRSGLVGTTIAERRARIEHIARRCFPSARVWARMFTVLAEAKVDTTAEEEEELLRKVYEYWCGTGDVEDATLTWARWLLLTKKRGEEAMRVILLRTGRGPGGARLAQRWAAIICRQGVEEEEGQDDGGGDAGLGGVGGGGGGGGMT